MWLLYVFSEKPCIENLMREFALDFAVNIFGQYNVSWQLHFSAGLHFLLDLEVQYFHSSQHFSKYQNVNIFC